MRNSVFFPSLLPVSDRLRELQHQRSLVQEQLAWLDREIAAASGNKPTTTPIATAPAPRPPSTNSASTVAAEAIISKYKSETDALQVNVKRGCFLYLAIAFAVVGLGVLALYLYSTSK